MPAKETPSAQSSSGSQVAAALEGLALSRISVDWRDEGAAVGALFRERPELPGVIINLPDGGVSGISKQEYLRHMARPFGPEIYNRRPVKLLLDHGAAPLSWMPGATLVEAAAAEILKRPESHRYEPLLTTDPRGQPGILDVHSVLIAVSQISALRARQMALILDTVPEGFLIIGPDRRILPGYSLSAAAMLGLFDLAGLTLPEALGHLNAACAERLGPFIEVLFNPALLDRLLEPANPAREFQARSADGGEMHLAIRFKRVREEGVITQLLVMIEDLTLRKRLEHEAVKLRDAARMRLEVLTQLAGADPEHLPAFLENYRSLAARLENPGPLDEPAALRRRCHALKGEAGTLGLASFRAALHKAEEAVTPGAPGREEALAALAELREAAADLFKLARKLPPPGPETPPPAPAPAPASRSEALAEMLSDAVREACERTGKKARLELRGCFDKMTSRQLGLLREALQQLARNAVIHGIEPPARRLAAGKPEEGAVIIAAREAGEFWEVIVQDDGAGLDVEALRRKAGEAGLGLPAEELIFADGVSTASAVDELAGRGIGLGQVRESVLIHGGAITAHSEPGRYTAFQIVLPRRVHTHETADR